MIYTGPCNAQLSSGRLGTAHQSGFQTCERALVVSLVPDARYLTHDPQFWSLEAPSLTPLCTSYGRYSSGLFVAVIECVDPSLVPIPIPPTSTLLSPSLTCLSFCDEPSRPIQTQRLCLRPFDFTTSTTPFLPRPRPRPQPSPIHHPPRAPEPRHPASICPNVAVLTQHGP